MALKKPAAKKKSAKSKPGGAAKVTTLHAFVSEIKAHASAAKLAGAEVGACDLSNSHTGGSSCIITDEKTCSSLGGSFRGGPCGG